MRARRPPSHKKPSPVSGVREAAASYLHPILDRSTQIRVALDLFEFECLSRDWRGWNAAYRFRCKFGHLFSKTALGLVRLASGDCPVCTQIKRTATLRAITAQAGVTCLETDWLGHSVMHRFGCNDGHMWERTGGVALRRPECPYCRRKSRRRRP